MKRREFLNTAGLSVGALTIANVAFSNTTYEEFVVTDTHVGKIKGYRENGVNIFKGIPYAGKISGERRFRRPAPLEAWDGVKDTLTLGAPAIQNPRRNEPAPSEDCLFLNVWTPANDGKKRPVMFYNHGGGFVIGSGGPRDKMGPIWRGISMWLWWKLTTAWDFLVSCIWRNWAERNMQALEIMGCWISWMA
jgi:para-nitrobenzyl esterase